MTAGLSVEHSLPALVDIKWNTVFQPAQYNKLCFAVEH